VKPIALYNYKVDTQKEVVFCDEKPLDCVDTARKAQVVSKRTFSLFTWIYFYAVDLLVHLFTSFQKKQFTVTSGLVGNLIKEQDVVLKQRKKVDEFVKKHFKVISQNVKNLDEAEVLCLGETHGTYRHMSNNAKLIDALSDEKDLILVEHDEKLSFRSDQAKYVKRPIPIKGWDKIDQVGLNEISRKLRIDDMSSLISMIFFGRLPREKLEDMQWANQKIIDELPERNQHMCQTIEKNRAKERRTYTIAGSGHLSSPEGKMYDGLNKKPQEVAFQETLAYLKTKKHAILVPK
jgi:hypothetical protein